MGKEYKNNVQYKKVSPQENCNSIPYEDTKAPSITQNLLQPSSWATSSENNCSNADVFLST